MLVGSMSFLCLLARQPIGFSIASSTFFNNLSISSALLALSFDSKLKPLKQVSFLKRSKRSF